MAENECPNFAGLFTAKVIKSHVKLHVKSDAQKVNYFEISHDHFEFSDLFFILFTKEIVIILFFDLPEV